MLPKTTELLSCRQSSGIWRNVNSSRDLDKKLPLNERQFIDMFKAPKKAKSCSLIQIAW